MLAQLCTALLPGASELRLDTIAFDLQRITLQVTSTQAAPPCPDCGHAAQRLHSGYVRTLADLPWADRAARIRLRVRRFFCDQLACARTTFTERLPALVAPYARRTRRLAGALADVGLALGGQAGARLAAKQHVPTSRNTLLRLIRQVPTPTADPPRVVGLDDWAKRKGHSYGTIVVDLETHQTLDLLEDRLAETVETWLGGQPTVEVISRDRAEAYAAGAKAGAPDAIQVADRFHLLKNLREAIEQELSQRGARIERTAPDPLGSAVPQREVDAVSSALAAAPEPTGTAALATMDVVGPHANSLSAAPETPSIYPDSPGGRHAETARQARRNERYAQYMQMQALRAQGLDQATIARRVGLSRRTISRWQAAECFPERKPRSGDVSSLEPYTPYLLERWQAGCHNGTQLWRMIQGQGFAGSYGVVAAFLAPLRRGADVSDGLAIRSAPTPPGQEPYYTTRQAAFLFLGRPDELTESEQHDLARMQAADGVLATLYTHTQEFASMLRERDAARLDEWLELAATSDFPELRRFANGIHRDYAAVRAACELPWSQGPVEGQITRLKLLKRQMYGRAKLDLLRQRMLNAA